MTTPWHEDESFWKHMAQVLFSDHRWESAPEEIEKLITLIRLTPESAVLDMPCGPGRHALEFARRGFRVTGVDITKKYLEEAARRAEIENLPVDLICEDMRLFSRPEAFDLAINLYSSFGYFRDQGDNERVAANFLNCLRPGGVLVMDMMGKEVIASNFQPRVWRELDDGGLMLEERTLLENWGWMRMRWMLIREGKQLEHTFELRIFAASELIDLLRGVGFSEVAAYGNLDGGPYDHQATRLIIVARK